MPKDLGSRSLSSHRSQGSRYKPYSSCSRGGSEGSSSKEGEEVESKKEWEDATCPICMEHPHNAVLLLCTSHDKGCRPYMCDTSYRHSNCLDQYKKAHVTEKEQAQAADGAFAESLSTGASSSMTRSRANALHSNVSEGDRVDLLLGLQTGSGRSGSIREHVSEHVLGRESGLFSESLSGRAGDLNGVDSPRYEERGALSIPGEGRVQDKEGLLLVCPLCRGKVKGWRVIDRARHHLNCKIRNCAQETCVFSGTYGELRKHARLVHPLARPSDVDPVRQRDWRRLERQRDIGDVLSTIRSAMPGATVFGDYVIDEDGEDPEDEVDESDFPGDEGNWWTVFLLFQVFGPAASAAGGRSFSARMRRFPRRHHFSEHSLAVRQALWGENFQLNRTSEGNRDSANNANAEGSTSSTGRRRRTRQ
ncbi:hypothetical protein O6H91_12G021100 [Diphasiastrum complanatum]|nr:hypothetical protein O6H91_12G021100 [Diphasiastrum complanatum]